MIIEAPSVPVGIRPNVFPFMGFLGSVDAADTVASLKDLQILYDGKTVWDRPLTTGDLYSKTMDSIKGNQMLLRTNPSFEKWGQQLCVLKFITAPSHNMNDVQPARSTTITIRGTFEKPVVAGTKIHIGLQFDQTLIVNKKNGVILALPIQ